MRNRYLFIALQRDFDNFSIEDAIQFEYQELFFNHIQFDRTNTAKLVDLFEILPVERVEFIECEFIDNKTSDFSKSRSLAKVKLSKCNGHSSFALSCLTNPHLQELIMIAADDERYLRSMKSILPNNLTSMADALEHHYSLSAFSFDDIETYLSSNAGIRNLSRMRNMVADASQRINTYIERNKRGRQRCRDVIYTLFLIKYYSSNNVFRLMDKHVLMVIARHLYASIGTKPWCE